MNKTREMANKVLGYIEEREDLGLETSQQETDDYIRYLIGGERAK